MAPFNFRNNNILHQIYRISRNNVMYYMLRAYRRTHELVIFLIIFFGFFIGLSIPMGLPNMLNTFMNTAYHLLLETVFYIMAITVMTGATASDETLDKIIYINPTMGTNIQPVAITIDREGYLYDGKPLGDHFPVAATFQLMRRGSGIEELNGTATGESQYYNLNGQHVSMPQKGIYIEQQGKKAEKRIIK